jgi:hypothetical protein
MSDDLTALHLLFTHGDAIERIAKEMATHPATTECPDPECLVCGARDCPHREPLHYHHDGCPACWHCPHRDPAQFYCGCVKESDHR